MLCAVPVTGDVVAVWVVVDALASANADVCVRRHVESLATTVAGCRLVTVGAALHVVHLASLEGVRGGIRHEAKVRPPSRPRPPQRIITRPVPGGQARA